MDSLDVEICQEGKRAGVLQDLVDLTDVVHASVEEQGFVVIMQCWVSVRW